MKELESKVLEYIRQEKLLDAGQKVLLAVSGGADSSALLAAMAGLVKAGALQNGLAVAHINHQLRGELADRDEDFVRQEAGKLGIEFISSRVDVSGYAEANKISIETAARELRRQELIKIAGQAGCNVIATAHNKNDNAETVIHRIWRGTAYRGLSGIWPKRQVDGTVFIRPLLCCKRQEIEQYLESEGMGWQSDHTNAEIIYTRNYIRHKMLPLIQGQSGADMTEMLFELAKVSRRMQEKVDAQVEAAWNEIVKGSSEQMVEIDPERFNGLGPAIKMEIFRRALVSIGSGERDLGQGHYNQMLATAEAQGFKRARLPGGYEMIKSRSIVISKRVEASPAEEVRIEIPGSTEFNGWQIETKIMDRAQCDLEEFKKQKTGLVEWFDYERMKGGLVARSRMQADRFKPLGANIAKKVGKFLTDARIGPKEKEMVFVIADSDKIVWLAPVRASDETRVKPKTKQILQIELRRNG